MRLSLVLPLALAGCLMHYMPVDTFTGNAVLDRFERKREPLKVRITQPDGTVIQGELITLHPSKAGVLIEDYFPVDVPLSPSSVVEVYKVDQGRVAVMIIGIVAAVATFIVVQIVSLASMSCPVVEVPSPDGTPVQQGELGGGSLFAALEAPDRLALPAVPPGPFTWAVARDPAETDHLDTLHLDLVEVPAGRALATADGRLVLVGEGIPVPAARLGDLDVTAAVAAADHHAPVSGLDAPDRDVLTVDLPDHRGAAAVLRLAGSPLPELALQRLWTAMGPHGQASMAAWGSQPDHAAEARGWRQAAALDLHVEVQRADGGWTSQAWIPSPGWIGARELAVPVPDDAVRLRLTAARGAFVVDRIAVAPVLDDDPTVHRLSPTAATVDGDDDHDVRSALAASDDVHLDLTPGRDRVTVTFDVPDLGVPTAAFAAAEVHYVPLPTDPAEADLRLARCMRGHPERFPALIDAQARAAQALAAAR